MKLLVGPVIAAIIASWTMTSQPPPADLVALARAANLGDQLSGWCVGEFRAGHPHAYAVAVPSPSGGGRYLVLQPGAEAMELGAYTGEADLACYSPDEARKLDRAIRQSETIEGGIAPRWKTTIVCAFTHDTTAVCWQHSPRERKFVRVGGWVT